LMGSDEKADRAFIPDVKITTPESGKKPKKKAGGVAVAERHYELEPVTLRAFIAEEHREGFVEIYEDDPELRLVTTIEVLSPSNKAFGTEGWHRYQSKRYSALLGHVHLIEIDLLRGGRRPLMRDPWPNSPYALLVGRANQNLRCQVWPAYFDRALTAISVPLTPPDADILLGLQPLIDKVYELSGYARTIDYRKPLEPPLTAKEKTWLEGRLREWPRST